MVFHSFSVPLTLFTLVSHVMLCVQPIFFFFACHCVIFLRPLLLLHRSIAPFHSWEMCVKSQTYSTVYAWGHALTSIIYSLYPWFWNVVSMNRSPFAFAVFVCVCDDYVNEYVFLCLPIYGVVVLCMSLHIPPSRWFSLL